MPSFDRLNKPVSRFVVMTNFVFFFLFRSFLLRQFKFKLGLQPDNPMPMETLRKRVAYKLPAKAFTNQGMHGMQCKCIWTISPFLLSTQGNSYGQCWAGFSENLVN